ncbi:MAG: hypothetical protein QW251_05390 [Desulfurococcaceae archaeon]
MKWVPGELITAVGRTRIHLSVDCRVFKRLKRLTAGGAVYIVGVKPAGRRRRRAEKRRALPEERRQNREGRTGRLIPMRAGKVLKCADALGARDAVLCL